MDTGLPIVIGMALGSITYSLWSISRSLRQLVHRQNVEVSFDPSIEFPPQLHNAITHMVWEAGQNFYSRSG